ncbi:MAG: MetQ/NlpA family ABC transporter substrate-binding protein, partial [Eubacterium sp.]
ASIHYEPLGLYAGKTKAVAELSDGATIAVPNDTTNEARALLLLENQGLIKLKEGVGLAATPKDIAENPKNLKIQELEAAQLARSLGDVDMAVINGNYALDADLKVSDALAKEEKDSEAAKTYANIIAVRKGEENSDKTKALIDALKSESVQNYILNTYGGAVVPMD